MEALGQLTGGIAHDFNNLLMAVLGSLELMRKRLPDDPKILALLENAMQGARRGSTLTQRMLAFARRQQLTQEPVNIPDLFRGMTDLLQRSLGPSVGIQTRFPLIIEPAFTDANQLEMALLNLTVNARDAMPDGGQIVIAADEETIEPTNKFALPPGRYICLSVQDNGTGMDAETLRRATEPFFTTKGPGKGTGLGLSMVYGLAEQCGGYFNLRSAEGTGTVAELWLPVAGPQLNMLAQDKRALEAVPSEQGSLVVLAVDDDALVLTNTIAMLEDLGHIGIAASSAKEALEILRSREGINLVITDQAMPHTTGLQLIGDIRKEWPSMPVILATGYAEMEPGTIVGLPRLAKPFTEAQLEDELLNVSSVGHDKGRVIKFRSTPSAK
jgi:CheY-like chemotaxis protein/two-component sensor histidine kinase